MRSKKGIIILYLFVCLLGVLLHFAYDWSGKNFIVGIFSAVNESTWEHLKLVFFPMLLLTIWDLYHSEKNDVCFLPARTVGILSAMAFIVTVFYTYVGVTGQVIDFINIVIYFLGVAFGFLVEKQLYCKTNWVTPVFAAIILIGIAFAFVILTYTAPNAGIFKIP